MRPSRVARTAAPRGYAPTGRVGLKAHPCACNPIHAIHRASRKRLIRPAVADPKGRVDQKTKHPPRSGDSAQRFALRAVDLHPVSGRRGGFGKARGVARRDSGQFAASTRRCCQRTPEPSRVVVRILRTTYPPRAHLWAPFLCEQKGCSADGSPARRSTNLGESQPVTRSHSASSSRKKRLTRLTIAKHEGEGEIASARAQKESQRSDQK